MAFRHLLRYAKITRNFQSRLLLNTAYVSSNNYSNQKPEEELVVKEKIQITKPVVTKWKRPPFVKNLFCGKFDTELLAFPEILDNELLSEVEKYVQYLNNLYVNKVNSRQIDETGKIPDDLLQDFKDLGLFGRMIPAKYGGLDLSYTACTRLNEVIGLDWSIYSLLTAHEFLATRVILLYGTEEQKDKYLPLLASGKSIAAFCCAEVESGNDLGSLSTTAVVNMDETFTISGMKCWVSNAELADVFIVFAKTPSLVDNKENDIGVFIVDKSDDILISPHEKTCLRGLKTSMVEFKEVKVPHQNLIGERGQGYEIYLKTLEGFRIAMNSFTFGALKALLDSVTERVINTERLECSLGDIQMVRIRLSRISSMLYAMESMAYYTAAILDSTENPDISLESAILKVFNTSGTLYCLRELIELLGSTSLMKEQHLERFYRDSIGLNMFDGPNDVARLFIGLTGCKSVGPLKAEEIMKSRNRFFFPMDAFKKGLRKTKLFRFKTKYDQDLAGYMHPSLVEWGNALEEKLQKFEFAVEEALTSHGKNIVETQIDPTNLANGAIYLYAMSAVLSRSSRSYCIGLKNAHHEVRLAGSFCFAADKILYENLNNVLIGSVKSYDGDHLLLGEQVIDCRGYFPEHPLKHNF